MIDPKLLRSDPQAVAANLARRGFTLDVTRFQSLEESRKSWQIRADELRNERNTHAKSVGRAKAQGQDIEPLLKQVETLGADLAGVEVELGKVQQQLDEFVLGLPNLLHDSVPEGRDENANVEVRRWGEPRIFDFKPKDHVEIGEQLGLLDFAAAGRISGARFAVLGGKLAALHRALIQFMLDLHTREHGYREMYVPYLVNAQALTGTGQLPKFEEDLFAVKGESALYLIPTAEVPVTNLVRDSILEAQRIAAQIRGAYALFPFRSGLLWQGHPRHDPPASVRESGAGPDRPAAGLLCGAGRADCAMLRRGTGVLNLPYRVMPLCAGRYGFRFCQDVRSGSLVARAAEISGNFFLFQFRSLPGQTNACPLAQSGNR